MKKITLLLICTLVSLSLAFAQTDPKTKTDPKKKTATKPAPKKKPAAKPAPKKKPEPKKKPAAKGKTNSKDPKAKAAKAPKVPVVNNFPKRDFKRVSITGMVGVPVTFFDLENYKMSPVYGGTLNLKLTHSLGLRFGFMGGQFSRGHLSTDTLRQRTSFAEISGSLVFNIGNINFIKPHRPIQMYSYVGFAMLMPEAISFSEWNAPLKPYTKTIYSVPVGLGLKYQLSNSIDILAEFGLRMTQSDSVDLWNPAGGAGVNNKSYDWYAFPAIGITYHFGKKVATPIEWSNPVKYMYDDLTMMKKTVEALKIDNDNDGVSDFFDREVNTPDSVNVYGSGKAVDTDRDGIPDHLDVEPFTDPGAQVDANGKSQDTDGDGVPDHKDLEPGTDTSMIVNHQGIAIISKTVAKELQSVPTDKAEQMFKQVGKIGYLPAIFFETDEFDVPSRYYADLYGVAHAMRNFPETKIYIIGGADMRKDEAYNLELARKRAQSVADILSKKFGIDRSRLIVQTIGKKDPLVDGKRRDALAANRRVTFKIVE